MSADEFKDQRAQTQARLDQVFAGISDRPCIEACLRFIDATDELFVTLRAHGLTLPEAAGAVSSVCGMRLAEGASLLRD